MKKLFLALTLVFSSATVLTGCGNGATTTSKTEVNKKAEAVKATKATIEGIAKGNKAAYEEYYGAGQYDEKIKSELASLNLLGSADTNLAPETQAEYLKLGQLFLNKVNVTYAEKSETEVTVTIRPLKLDQNSIKEWVTNKIQSGELTTTDLTDSSKAMKFIIEAVNKEEIKSSEAPEVTKTAKVKEVNGKFEVDNASAGEISQSMYVQP